MQIWNHPGLLQLAKEHKANLRREDAVENFLIDDGSSDDNMDNGDLLTAGVYSLFLFSLFWLNINSQINNIPLFSSILNDMTIKFIDKGLHVLMYII